MLTASIRQRKAARGVIEAYKQKKPISGGQIVKEAGYGTGLQTQPQRVLNSVGVQIALNDYGFTEDNAKKVVASILLSRKTKDENKLKASDLVFKVHGTYAPEKSINLNVSATAQLSDQELENIAYNVDTPENEAPQAP